MQQLSTQFGIDRGRIGLTPYTFLSYAHVDAQRVYPYFAALQQAGQNIWFDEGIRAGRSWEEDIADFLTAADSFLFFVTEASLRSQNCMDELFRAREQKKTFINILVDNIDLSNPEYSWFQFRFSRFQQIPAYAMSMEEVIFKILQGLGAAEILSPEPEAAPMPMAAPRPVAPKKRQEKPRFRLKEINRGRMGWLIATAACLLYALYCAIFETGAEAIAMAVIAMVALIFAYDAKDFKIEKSELMKYKGKASHVRIPPKVSVIREKAFCEKAGIKTVTIPDSVTAIGESAFGWCKGLERIALPSSVKTVGPSAFYCCEALMELELPNSVSIIGESAFRWCTSLGSVHLPSALKSIDEYTFSDCRILSSVSIPRSVKFIRDGAFQNCQSLGSITIPDSVVAIGQSAFEGCESLTSITIPQSVTKMDICVFSGCTALETIYCQHPQQPRNWDSSWLSGCNAQVIWGVPEN